MNMNVEGYLQEHGQLTNSYPTKDNLFLLKQPLTVPYGETGSCVGSHSCCEFTTMSSPEGRLLPGLPVVGLFTAFLPSLLSPIGDVIDVLFRAWHSVVTSSQHFDQFLTFCS